MGRRNFIIRMLRKTIYLLPLLCLIACNYGEKKEDKRTVFRYNEIGTVTSLDPAAAVSFENISIINQLFNGLVELDDSLHIKPSLAKSWSLSDDKRNYTFSLRRNVVFHNNPCFLGNTGRKVTANDFVYSFNRLFDAKLSSATTLLSYVENENGKAFEAPNDSTFVIHLKKPFQPFLGILCMKYFSVVPREAIDMYGEEFRRNPVGTGPFKFKLWENDSKIVLLRNENYFEQEQQNQLPYLDAVSVSFIKDKETSFLNFLNKKTDMISGIDAINTDEVLTPEGKINDKYKNSFAMQCTPFLKTDYLGFVIDEGLTVVKSSPLRLRDVRQAMNYGIDRNKMVSYLRKNLGIAGTAGFIPPGLPTYDGSKLIGYDYNPEMVRKLLNNAGYPNGKGLPEITLATTEQYLELAEYVQSQLSEFGIRIKIDVQKSSVLAEAAANGKINFFRKSWVADYADEENFLSLFYSKNWSPKGFNYTHFKNSEFDSLYEKSEAETVDSIRLNYYRKMDSLIMNEAPVLVLYYDEAVRLVQNNISGLHINSLNLLNLKKVKKG